MSSSAQTGFEYGIMCILKNIQILAVQLGFGLSLVLDLELRTLPRDRDLGLEITRLMIDLWL